jgi:hypothetical protein
MVSSCRFKNYAIQLVPGVILFYDYFLTLDEEVAYYWQKHRPFTWISILFLATRYVTLLSFTPVFISMLTGNATLVRALLPTSAIFANSPSTGVSAKLLCLVYAFTVIACNRCGVIQDFHNIFEIILQVPVGCTYECHATVPGV